jgi:1-deoxy-D-xylulose-5-phosphate synthase
MNTPLLDRIHEPEDLKKMSAAQVEQLCEEIRRFLLESVSKTGGHLASNLGMVEVTVALHRVLNSPEDKIVFDVGHQCYTHKLLTGRKEGFAHLRQLNGISGFTNPRESEHDAFIAGHGNTALSLAIGMAYAKKLKGEPGQVIAVIGDGAFTGGMVYEGMNNIGALDNLIVILNDNKMSISHNVGTMARYLTRLRSNPKYYQAKADVHGVLGSVPVIGKPMIHVLQVSKAAVRQAMYHSTMFEDMGFQYVGPVDGHKEAELEELLRNVKDRSSPLFLHVVTTKGKGYSPAEKNPGEFHGVSSFDLAMDFSDPEVAPKESFSTVFGKTLSVIGDTEPSLCAITAAMKYGTGLQFFSHSHPERFFDVGMAEQHAVTFAAGLASQGMLPVVAIYSTFLQRSYDQLIHDVNLLKENVLIAIDRAGLVPADGETHQGIYDPAFLSEMEIPLYSPSNYEELRYWLYVLTDRAFRGPRAIRYPRGGESARLARYGCSKNEFDRIYTAPDAKAAMVSYASEVEDALQAAELLQEKTVSCDVYKLVKIYPFTEEFLAQLQRYAVILCAEECVACGCIGEHLLFALHERGWTGKFVSCAVQNDELPHATVPEMKRVLHLSAVDLAQKLEKALEEAETV